MREIKIKKLFRALRGGVKSLLSWTWLKLRLRERKKLEIFLSLGWIMLAIGIAGIIAGILIFLKATIPSFVGGVILIVVSFYLLSGIRTVQQQQRIVVEMFGKYFMTLKPGLSWILPRVMKVRASINIWQRKIDLFDKPIKIDFKDGSASPKGAEAWVRIKSPDSPYSDPPGIMGSMTGVERAIYEVEDWKVALKDLFENAIRSYLNGLTIDDGITRKGAGFDLKNDLFKEQRARLEETLAGWGFELMQVTIMDFDLEPELVKARGQVQIRRRAAEAAVYVREQRATETVGALIEMMAIAMNLGFEATRDVISKDADLRARVVAFAEEIVTRRMSLDNQALTDIRVAGAGDLGSALTAIITAIKKA